MPSLTYRRPAARHALVAILAALGPSCSPSPSGADANNGMDAVVVDRPAPDAMDVVVDVQPTCTAGQVFCGFRCTDTLNDRAHCGACDQACQDGYVCVSGMCAQSCPGTEVLCDGACRDVQTDTAHCGACGNVCPAGTVCAMGQCSLSCGTSLATCTVAPAADAGVDVDADVDAEAGPAARPYCADTRTDRRNCGACGTTCPAGHLCTAGACTPICPPDQVLCEGACRDLLTDRAHCGRCGRACNAGSVCSAGTCAPSCTAGLTLCSGVCRDLDSDRTNCGVCGRTCPNGQRCSSGGCVPTCRPGLTACGTTCYDLQSDPTHCGNCSTACGTTANGQGFCAGGSCGFRCASGYADCNGMAADGCETVLSTVNNCGACRNVCQFPNAAADCILRQCVRGACSLGFADCNASALDGCEVDTRIDPANCGACGVACAAGSTCQDSQCVANCAAGQRSCSGFCVDVLTDRTNCGGCNTPCPSAPGAEAVCAGGMCGLRCVPGFANCDGDGTNGCETAVDTIANCGACGRRCDVSQRCVAGMCQ